MATVLTNVGEEWAAASMARTGTGLDTAASHIGWGTPASTTAAKGDTTLAAEAGTRGAATISLDGSGSSAKFKAVATLSNSSGGAYAIKEAGLFTASASGSLLVHGDFAVINLNDGDQITFTITIDPQ